MSVETVGTALASVESDITGIETTYAHDEIPTALNTSALPAIMNFPDEAEYTYISHGFVQEIRLWRVQLYVEPRARDTNVARQGEALGPFFRRVFLEFLDSIQLESLADVVCARVLRDTGWSVLEWGGIEYVGTEFIVQVTEKFTETDYGP